jgi:hypothetical protein
MEPARVPRASLAARASVAERSAEVGVIEQENFKEDEFFRYIDNESSSPHVGAYALGPRRK